jgi:hypothetical protein
MLLAGASMAEVRGCPNNWAKQRGKDAVKLQVEDTVKRQIEAEARRKAVEEAVKGLKSK